jgi:hypothetical protein
VTILYGSRSTLLADAERSSLPRAVDDSTVHIFWDHSNVFISALDACDDWGVGFEPGHRWDARVHFRQMFDFAAAVRNVERAVAVGSIPPGLSALWSRLSSAGIDIELQERGAETGKEQAVDEALQLHMLRSVLDRGDRPAVAVLLTGDGGYCDDAKRMLDAGWGVEVLCFGRSLSGKWRELARHSHGRAKYVDLDQWYRQLVYLQGFDEEIMRPAESLDLTGRPTI